ncbi:hypothetical protein DSM106972_063120 [Dulcicalothrix desertica PCC 7102]|uniref:Actin-fragmin kinase catalytic domain-containing protein n=1 Tax=Dulcicalothrix desertica PCC 7102 TaxID=232991 RepID=A0A433V841_9CYAN|nr:hypothetical protein [Dulcicalothrix desertica]RUT02237.1 hypothetical protein DSM106972_063120 [Dulcicalothrix desertica PCC 7102]TWH53878.1 actin-fragmin kinase-like protein [Dulcicalothrix desertica PCC 7102]
MRWNRLKYVIRSEYGQDGVYFISDGQTKQVLKAPDSPYSELFLSLLAESFDLNTPEIKAFCPENQQYEEIIRYIKPEIESINRNLRETQKQEEQKNEYERDFELIEKRTLNLDSSPTFFLMENLKGRSLRDITSKNLIDWYGTDEQLNGAGRKFFKDLGKLLVFDLLVRNVDRFIFWQLPGIGEVESALGNIGNIFIQDSTKELIVIDSLTDMNIEVVEYAEAVKEIFARTLNASPDNLIDRGQQTLELIGYEVKKNSQTLILEGVNEGINHLHNLTQADTLEQIKQESLRQLSQSEERKIDMLSQFIKKIVEYFSR